MITAQQALIKAAENKINREGKSKLPDNFVEIIKDRILEAVEAGTTYTSVGMSQWNPVNGDYSIIKELKDFSSKDLNEVYEYFRGLGYNVEDQGYYIWITWEEQSD